MLDLLRTRRSVRQYTGESIPPEKIAALEEALLRSPSSRNRRPWAFVFVDDPALLADLARCKPHGSSFLDQAALGIVVCGDEQACDVWVEDCSIASILVHVTAHSLGLGSCWIQVRQRKHASGGWASDYVRELLGIPGRLQVESIIAVGVPAVQLAGHPREKLDFAKVTRNRYA